MSDERLGPEVRRNLEHMLDLNRTQITRDIVEQMEAAMRRQHLAGEDLRAIVAAAKEQEYPLRDIAAMKQIARLRLSDKCSEASDKLEALQRIGKTVGVDLFDWAGVR